MQTERRDRKERETEKETMRRRGRWKSEIREGKGSQIIF